MTWFDVRARGLALLAIGLGMLGSTLAACFGSSSSSGNGGAHFDAGFEGATFDTTSPDSPEQEASTDAGTSDGGASLCTRIGLSNAPFVNTVSNTVGAAPPMTGGPIVPGDYAASAVVAYDPSANTSVTGESPFRSMYRFSASTLLTDTEVYYSYDASPDSPPSAEAVIAADYAVDGSTLTTTRLCDLLAPDSGAVVASVSYTSTATSLQFSRPIPGDAGIVEVITYVKQ